MSDLSKKIDARLQNTQQVSLNTQPRGRGEQIAESLGIVKARATQAREAVLLEETSSYDKEIVELETKIASRHPTKCNKPQQEADNKKLAELKAQQAKHYKEIEIERKAFMSASAIQNNKNLTDKEEKDSAELLSMMNNYSGSLEQNAAIRAKFSAVMTVFHGNFGDDLKAQIDKALLKQSGANADKLKELISYDAVLSNYDQKEGYRFENNKTANWDGKVKVADKTEEVARLEEQLAAIKAQPATCDKQVKEKRDADVAAKEAELTKARTELNRIINPPVEKKQIVTTASKAAYNPTGTSRTNLLGRLTR